MMMKRRIAAGALSALLTLSLCMGLGTTAFAEQISHGYIGKITKELNMDENVTIPDATFNFKVEKYSMDGSTEADKLAEMPAIADQTLTFGSGDESTTDSETRVKTVTKETGFLLDGITFPRVGVYVYEITEQADTYTAKTGETMIYTSSPCYMTVYVENGALTPVVKNVDYRWGTPDNAIKGDPTFNNNFMKIGSSDDQDSTDPSDLRHEVSALEIAKTVTGAMGDKTKEFNFTLRITQLTANLPMGVISELLSVDAETRMNVGGGGSLIERPPYHGTIHRNDGSTEEITIQAAVDATCTFTLKDGEYVTFSDMPVGTKYTVTEAEAGANGYTTTVASLVDGQTGTTTENNLVGENANMVGFTNNKEAAVPTGIIVNNLPFVMLIFAAVCGFAGYIVFRRKRFYN